MRKIITKLLTKVMPEHFEVVYQRVKAIRTDFSKRDPEHDSSRALNTHTIAFADQMFSKTDTLRLADAGSR